jgi:hypothetical protein
VLPGGRVDRGHPAVENWMAMAVIGSDDEPTGSAKPGDSEPSKPTAPGKTQGNRASRQTGQRDLSRDENGFFPGLYGYTHKQVAERFSTFTEVADIVDLHYKTEQSRKLWLSNEVAEGKLIERERVRTHVLGFVEASHKRILSDAPKTIASRLLALSKSGASLEECEKFARETLGAILRPARDSATRNLRPTKPKKQTPPPEDDE